MDVQELKRRAERARDELGREKARLLARAWDWQTGEAMDKLSARIASASEGLTRQVAAAADRGGRQLVALRISLNSYDLRHVVQDELNRSRDHRPDPYPRLRALGPPSFREIEKWLSTELGVQGGQQQCPLPWGIQLRDWVRRRGRAPGWRRWLLRRPPLPERLQALYDLCSAAKLHPVFVEYEQFEDQGVALQVSW